MEGRSENTPLQMVHFGFGCEDPSPMQETCLSWVVNEVCVRVCACVCVRVCMCVCACVCVRASQLRVHRRLRCPSAAGAIYRFLQHPGLTHQGRGSVRYRQQRPAPSSLPRRAPTRPSRVPTPRRRPPSPLAGAPT
jgi:hypothetical protein